MKDEMDEIFDTRLIEESLKKAQRKSRRRIIVITTVVCIAVFTIGSIANIAISMKMADACSDSRDINIRTSIPNGYVGEERATVGFLGRQSEYKLAKNIDGRMIFLETETTGFGNMMNYIYLSIGRGGASDNKDGWPNFYWDNGYKKMLFFHPELEYKAYKNDLPILDKLSDMQVIEMGLSFDQGYDEWAVGKFLKDFNITWAWIDNYSEEQLETWQREITESKDSKCYITEEQLFGISVHDNIINEFEHQYTFNLNQLEEYNPEKYEALQEAGLDESKNAKIIGVTVQGTPEELKALSEVKEIKGATIGCVINTY